jgi:Cid1 family poly A polymerase
MIINFLQTRKPPILPALHQRPHLKLPSQDGHETAFADDVDALRGYGKENKETLGELLFQFFRYYGHEIDYDKSVVSVRNGRLTSKVDKGWHLATNNRLCVEEPFNIGRNLGNTADDTSFRGLHMELRRAFDLIGEAKLAECCEEYVFPKEEERIWEKPVPQPRPILSRSTSQSRGGKGGNYRGGKHNNHARNGNNNRRASSASSGAFDNNSSYVTQALPPGMTAQEAWIHNQAAQERLHNDLYTTFSVLQAQENNLRLQLYTQSQAYAQAQAQAYHQAQRGQGNGGVASQQTADRHRGSSFDNPPLTAPLRPEMYFYPLHYQGTPMYGQHSPSTYPSSPSMSPALPELRRSLHRSTITGGQGAGGSSSGSLRSHSQPATRSVQPTVPLQGLGVSNVGMNDFGNYRQPNGVIIPNFIADENMEIGVESESSTFADSPPNGTPKEYVGYYVNEPSMPPPPRRDPVVIPAIPAFGDIQRRRRVSTTEQFPQIVLDRIRRTSRTPSPHRTHSTSLISSPFKNPSQQYNPNSNLRASNEQGPAVINGSGFVAPSTFDQQASADDAPVPDKLNYDTSIPAVHLASKVFVPNPSIEVDHLPHAAQQVPGVELRHDSPPVVDGSSYRVNDREYPSPTPLVTNGVISITPPRRLTPEQVQENRLEPSKGNRSSRQSQNGAMSPLDIGPGQSEALRDEFPHLSPVYETHTPSPTANRKFEPILDNARAESKPTLQTGGNESKPALKLALSNSTKGNQKQNSVAMPNGHTRAAKSEGSGPGTWQKIPKSKKKGNASDQNSGLIGDQNISEQIPGIDFERKGG